MIGATMSKILVPTDPLVMALVEQIKDVMDLPDNLLEFSIHFSVKDPVRIEAKYLASKKHANHS